MGEYFTLFSLHDFVWVWLVNVRWRFSEDRGRCFIGGFSSVMGFRERMEWERLKVREVF